MTEAGTLDCLSKCAAETPWALYLPLAYAALSFLNGVLRVPKGKRDGVGKMLDWLHHALDRISFHSRHDAKGTLKVPFTGSKTGAPPASGEAGA